MKINFKQPKYVLPLLILPFLCLFFYVWQSGKGKQETNIAQVKGLNPNVGNVADGIRKKQLADKLDAYRNTYKEAGGNTAVGVIPSEQSAEPTIRVDYTQEQRRRIDSVQHAMQLMNSPHRQAGYSERLYPNQDLELQAAVKAVQSRRNTAVEPSPAQQPDPMETFRQQMSIMDSMTRQNDPAWKEEQRKKQLAVEEEARLKSQPRLTVYKAGPADPAFNTVLPEKQDNFITAVIDENITGYAGSRLRLKLQEDIRAGGTTIPKNSYLYARITGFAQQRVTLAVTSILSDGKILPVRLDVYDNDGLPGLYVPESAFREFTKDLGSASIQGVTIDGGTGTNQFMMSSLDKLFQSTSSAIAGAIRKNKARLKFNSFIYLIDSDALQNAQKKY